MKQYSRLSTDFSTVSSFSLGAKLRKAGRLGLIGSAVTAVPAGVALGASSLYNSTLDEDDEDSKLDSARLAIGAGAAGAGSLSAAIGAKKASKLLGLG